MSERPEGPRDEAAGFELSLKNHGAEDFPVLRAFQGYLEAERKKAQRKIMLLSITFTAVLAAVVVLFGVVFAVMVSKMVSQQERAQEKMYEMVDTMTRGPQPAQTAPAPQESDKTTAIALEKLHKLIAAKDAAKASEPAAPVTVTHSTELPLKPAAPTPAGVAPAATAKPLSGLPPVAPADLNTTAAEKPVVKPLPPAVTPPKPAVILEQPAKKLKPAPKPEVGVVLPEPPSGTDRGVVPVSGRLNDEIQWRVYLPK